MAVLRPALLVDEPARPAAVAVEGERSAARGTRVRRLLATADTIAVLAALAVAFLLSGRDDWTEALAWGLLSTPVWVLVFKVYGLYDRDHRRISHSTIDDAPWAFHALLVGALGLWLLLKVAPPGHLVLAEALVFLGAANVLVLAARSVARETNRRTQQAERVLVVGRGGLVNVLVRKMRVHPEYGLDPVGRLDDGTDRAPGDLPRLGGVADLEDVCRKHGIDRVVVAPALAEGTLADLVRRARRLDVRLGLVPDGFDVLGESVEVDDLEGVTVLGLNPPALTRSSRALKRGTDVVLAGVALVVLAPVLGAVALAIRLTSPGPALFVQERVGRHGRPFRLVKFRTMVVDADARTEELRAQSRDPHWLLLDEDPRITPVGRFLRRTSLDELPQLWNVVRGDMSLVGPRPLTPRDAAQVSGWGLGRLDLTPGLTGLWQVLGRTTIPFEEMVKLDYLYVANWSLWGDLRLLVRTLPAVLLRRGVN